MILACVYFVNLVCVCRGSSSTFFFLCITGQELQKIYARIFTIWEKRPCALRWQTNLKLPSLFADCNFLTFHTKSHNMKALVILSHSWSPFLPLTCLYWNNELLCVSGWPSGDYPSHDHDHQWAVFVMSWLLLDKRKCEHNGVTLVFIYILLITYKWVHMALAINRPDILLM